MRGLTAIEKGHMQHTGVAASDATVLWAQVATLLSLAWLLGAAARRIGQPPIVGSLLAGLLAGPSVFGQVWPAGFHWFRPSTGLLTAVADFSLLVLLIALGAETDLRLIRRAGHRATTLVASSLVLPLAAGVVVALSLPHGFLGNADHRTAFVVIFAAAMAVSSLPVIARIVTEMGVTRRDVGQLSFAAATVNDAVGFVLLAVAVSLVDGGGITNVAVVIGGLLLLVVAAATGGQRLIDLVLRRSRSGGPDVTAAVGATTVFAFVVAAIAQALGVDAALGAFLAGIIVGRSRYMPPRALAVIETASDSVFAPLYFATAGVSVDITLLDHDGAALWFLVVLVVAVLAKLVGVFGGVRLAGVHRRDAFALGVVLNGRGALQVILATAGVTAGIISPTGFAVIILLSIASSVAVPPVLRRVLRGWKGSDEEQRRLEHEDKMSTNVVVRGQRLLLPSRGSPNSVAAARILDLAWPQESEVTLLHVIPELRDETGIARVRQMLGGREVREEFAAETDVVEAVLAEANLGYGVVAVGAAEDPAHDGVLPAFIEKLLNHAPIPVVIVRRGSGVTDHEGWPAIRPRQILVAVTGTVASRAGQEVAGMIGRSTGADIQLTHVVTGGTGSGRAGARRSADAVLAEARRDADSSDVTVETVTTTADNAGAQICVEAEGRGADLVVLGTTVRRVDDHPFLGHTVTHVLEQLTEPTVVVVVLPDAQQAAAEEHIDRAAG